MHTDTHYCFKSHLAGFLELAGCHYWVWSKFCQLLSAMNARHMVRPSHYWLVFSVDTYPLVKDCILSTYCTLQFVSVYNRWRFAHLFEAMFTLCVAYCYGMWCVCVTVREESGFAVNSIKESQNESLNHSNDSISSVGDIAEFSDEEDVPSGEYFTSLRGETVKWWGVEKTVLSSWCS